MNAKLNNPTAELISVPFQANYDERYGPGGEGHKFYLNVQPVVPFKLNNGCMDFRGEHRVHLRLEGRAMVGAH
jgi:hypothetical protein